ncbi:MAG: fibronectin type III domain-containing protein, partial [Clostridiales bacterium]|nr:fibronectin type III domain-containing protein [Clostridiales bacterium]
MTEGMKNREYARRTARRAKRAFCVLLCAALYAAPGAVGAPTALYAASAPPPPALTGLLAASADIVLDNAKGQSTVLFDHDPPAAASPPAPANPVDNDAEYTARVVKYYLNEYAKGYRGQAPARTFEDARSRDFTPAKKFQVSGLPSGALFDTYATNYMRFEEYPKIGAGGRTPGSTQESAESNRILFYTGTQLEASLLSADQVRLVWDDVWYNDRRIYGYTINVYTSSDTSPANLRDSIPISQNQIGTGRPVTVNQGTGKLEYVYRVPYPGRVYSFEVVPVMDDIPGVVTPAKNAVVTVASRISVSASKINEDPVGNLITWEIKWSNVTAGMGSDRRYTAEYTLSKTGGGVSYAVLQKINNYTSTILVTPREPDDPANVNATYEITARIFADGDEMYVGSDKVTISSGPFVLRESETPVTPQAPQLILDVAPSEASPAAAQLWWNVPKLVTDPKTDDLDVRYEIFVLDDPKFIDTLSDPATAQDIAPDHTEDGLSLPRGLSKTGNEVGYPYTIENLQPNATYYLAVRAVKSFIDISDMSVILKYSEIAYVVVTTPPQKPFGRPPAPTTLELVKDSVAPVSAAFTVQSVWYEQFETSAPPGAWVYRPGYDPGASAALPEDYRRLAYEAGDQILLYYAELRPDMDPDKPEDLPSGTYSATTLTVVDPKNPAVRIPVTGLTPNTVYLFWARAARAGQAVSYPSKTILVTTPPLPNTDAETPTVPDFDFTFIGDTYVDLVWEKKPDYRYSVQFSTADVFTGANVVTRLTSTREILESGVDFYRVTGLLPDTLYYFRIRAEVTSPLTGELKVSAWSDSKPARTKPPLPPATPSGFGVKAVRDAITKNSILYDWLQVPGIEYILEYGQNAAIVSISAGTPPAGSGAPLANTGTTLSGSAQLNAGAVTEYDLTGLLSNHRYYARLYARDPVTGLVSAPTYVVGVRTLRSDDDYDSNADTSMPLTGDFVKKDDYAKDGVWHVTILGTDADRFAERVTTDTMLDYVIDLSQPPRYTQTVNLLAEAKVFESLDAMRENLELKLTDKSLVIRPHTLAPGLGGSAAKRLAAPRYELLIGLSGGALYQKPGGLTLKTTPTGFDVNVRDGGISYPIEHFLKGVRVVVPFTGAAWYQSGVTGGGFVGPDGKFNPLASAVSFDPDTRRGRLVFDSTEAGSFFAADLMARGLFSDVSGKYAEYVNRLFALGYSDTAAGAAFRPNDAARPEEAIGLLYRAMGYETGGSGGVNEGEKLVAGAVKAGFLGSAEQTDIKIEEALALAARVYAVRAGVRIPTAPVEGAADALGLGARAWAPGLGNLPEPVRSS